MKFEDLNLNDKTVAALHKLGYLEATEVQQKTIPEIIAGNNVLVRSQTGTGKTAAFGIALIERIAAGKSKKALVLAPTRELAVQVCAEIKNIGHLNGTRVHVVYGGQSIDNQIREIRGGVDVLVATPGRLLDLARRGAVHINEFDMIVLDEADMMLDMGFIDEVGEILDQLPQQRLSVLLSATLEAEILQMAHKYVKHPKIIEIGQKEVAETVVEEYVEATDREKFGHLVDILRKHAHMKILVFRETKMGSDRLQQRLWERGFKAGVLQGDMSQAKRNAVLAAFKEGQISILVATNVAARGLHIADLGLVVNFDKAQSEEIHLHRVGRTGRMSTEGKAITFVRRPESRQERMSSEHPDFAWMRQGGLQAYRAGERRPPMQRRGPPPSRGPNPYGSGFERREGGPAHFRTGAPHGHPAHRRPEHGRSEHGRTEHGTLEHSRSHGEHHEGTATHSNPREHPDPRRRRPHQSQ
jgi:ATP-dependent RNA helicase DeaD